MPSTTAILESATNNNVSSSVEFANSFCRSSDNCSLADNSSSCSDLSTDSGAVVYNTGTSETTSVKSCASVDQSPDSRRLSLNDGDDSSSQSFPDDHFTNSGASSPAGVCYQCEVDSTSAAVTSLSQQQHHNQQQQQQQQQSISQRANQDEPAHLHRHTHPSHLLTNYHPHLLHQHHSHSEDVTRSVQSLKAETVSATYHHPHPYPHQHPNPQQSQKSQNGVYDNANNSTNSNNNKFNRYSRRTAGQGKKPRHYSNSFVTQAGYYPCNICCYSYSPLFEIGNQAQHQPGGNSRLYRNRSYSASQTQQQQHPEGVSAVLTLAECAYLYSNYRKRSSLYNLTGDEEGHILNIGQRSFDLRDVRYDVLTFDQVRCLNSVLDQTVKIKSDLHTEVVEFSLMNLILAVKKRLLEKEIVLYDIRLNGGAASHVLSLSSSVYNDIDLIFFVDLKNNDQFERVREAVLEVLLEFIPAAISEKRRIIETFVNKMVKVSEIDRWSLISLCNYGGRNVELKFVDSMRRQYEFSVDSFQVVLDTLLQFCSINSELNPMTYNFYPTVVGESMFGNFSEAMFHLHHRLIVTKKPEEIRGGGLLKYCNLLVRKFYPIDEKSVKLLEPYMCTRFFIDFFYYECQRDKLKNYLTTHFGNDTLLKYNFMIIFFAVIRRSSSVASHHASAMLDFEKLTMDLYSVLLTEYLTLYLTNYSKVQDFFARCQEMRACQCPKYLRSCIHRYLNPVYSITSPIVVTYVDDAMVDNVPKDERKKNLAKFIDSHDELFPLYGGFSFAFFPSTLFDRHESNHYVVSSSTLKNLPSSRFVRPEPPSADYLCTFLMKPTNNGQQPMIQIIPLGIQDLLPKSFHAIDYSNPNLVSPAMAFHFFPPIAPPHAYRFCIVNRIPIYYSETIASGPIYNSQVISMHYPQPQAPAPPPPQQQQQTQSAQSTLNSVTTALGVKESPQQVNLSQFPLPPVYPHHHLHSHHAHNPFHHHHHHLAQQQPQPQLPSHHNNNLHFNFPHHHHHHPHPHQHPTHVAPGSLPIYSPVPYFPHYLPSPSGQTSPPRSKKSLATATSANQQSQQSPVCEQIPPLIEPLRIVYPRLTQMESVVAQPAKPTEIANGEHSWTERFRDTGAVTTQQLDNVDIGSTTTTNTAAKQPQQSEQTQKLPFPIPQIAINGNATNGYTADTVSSGTQVKRSFAATTKANIHNQPQQSCTNNATTPTAKMSINSKKHSLPQTVTFSAPVTTANSNKSQNGTVLRKGAPSISSKKKSCPVSE